VKNAPVVAYPDDEEEIEYDSDGNPIAPEKSKVLNYVPNNRELKQNHNDSGNGNVVKQKV